MLSIRELLVLAVIIFVVWYGYRVYARIDSARTRRAADQARRSANKKPELDLVRCPQCGAYISDPNIHVCDPDGPAR
ncbi:hypothetical protein [Fodinicurvata sp. EGI_FJ10296]|uniref:hypothetical protein n=1 Tax=Fodinicurvata sp. EGI_FJ10296 TaxID=3231908 RepID=UPI0034516092